MDRGWHYLTPSGPERPRYGQQPYDRGRGVSYHGRTRCYECGQEGHKKIDCPLLQEGGRHDVPGKFMERSMGNNVGRWGNESWQPLRNSSLAGREHGQYRGEGMRETGGSRRGFHDYHNNGDVNGQRFRDMGDRYRDRDGRGGHGFMAPSNGFSVERESRHDRMARRASDEDHEATGGHRGEDRRDSRNRDGTSRCEERGALRGTFDNAAAQPPVDEGEDKIGLKRRTEERVKSSERLSKSPSHAEHVSHQGSGGKATREEFPPYKRDRGRRSESVRDKDGEAASDYASKGMASSKRRTDSRPSLSDLCKDAEEHPEKIQKVDKSAVSPAANSTTPNGVTCSPSGKSLDATGVVPGEAGNVHRFDAVTTGSDMQHGGESFGVEDAGVEGKSLAESQQGDFRDRTGSRETDDDFSLLPVVKEGSFMKGSNNARDGLLKLEDSAEYVERQSPTVAVQSSGSHLGFHSIANGDHSSLSKEALTEESDAPLGPPQTTISDEAQVEAAVCDTTADPEKHPSGDEETGRKGQLDGQVKDPEPNSPGTIENKGQSGGHVKDPESDFREAIERRGQSDGHVKEPESDFREAIEERGQSDGHVKDPGSDFQPTFERRSQLDDDTKDRESECRAVDGEAFENVAAFAVTQNDFGGYPHSEHINSSCSGTPFRSRHSGRDTEYFQHLHRGCGSRESSIDGSADRSLYASHGRTGLRAEYRSFDHGPDKYGEWNGATPSSRFRVGDEDRDKPAWAMETRITNFCESYPGHRLYRPGSYAAVCNARSRTRGRSPAIRTPPLYSPAICSEPFVPLSQTKHAVSNVVENESNSWMYHDLQGIQHGPVDVAQLSEMPGVGQAQSDFRAPPKENMRWIAPELACPPHSTLVPRSFEIEEAFATNSLRPAQASLQVPVHDLEEILEEEYNLENADQDICPPGTEALCPIRGDDDQEDFHIDERVEKLMEGWVLIPGKEDDVVYEALSFASSKIRQEYESDVAVEDSPRSHGGFGKMGDQWKDAQLGRDIQGLESFGAEQPVTKVDDAKVEETVPEARTAKSDVGVSSAPKPASHVDCGNPVVESIQEPWKWPSRGGDWKLFFFSDHSQHSKGEGSAAVEKGTPGHLKKVILNGGRPLCDSTTVHVADPRKQLRESGRVAGTMRLPVPTFAHNIIPSGLNVLERSLSQSRAACSPALKSQNANAMKAQCSTANLDISTPGKYSAILAGTPSARKHCKSSLSQLSGSGTGGKAALHSKKPKASGKCVKDDEIVNSEGSVVAERHSAWVESSFKQGLLTSETSLNGVDSKSASDARATGLVDETSGIKRKPLMDDGEGSAQQGKSSQRRRLLSKEDRDGDNVAARSSQVSHAKSFKPSVIDDDTTHPGVDDLRTWYRRQEPAVHPSWVALDSSILRRIFHSLHGDVKTLVCAMVTCKSWLDAGLKCKAELQLADLSLIEGQKLDAVLKSLPEFGRGMLRKIIFQGCTVRPESLRHLLAACPSISDVEIACNEDLKEVFCSFPNVKLVGDRNGVQSHVDHIVRRQRDLHLKKKKKVKRIAYHEAHSKDGGESETNAISDRASKVMSPDLFSSVISTVDEVAVNDSTQESSVTHFERDFGDGVKSYKSTTAASVVRNNGFNGTMRGAKSANGNSFFHASSKRKALALPSHGRTLLKNPHRMLNPPVGIQRVLADKHSSTTLKVFHHSKVVSSTSFDGDKVLEKELTILLKEMMDADTDKCLQVVHCTSPEGKGPLLVGVKPPDLLAIERKLKTGAYFGGKVGFNTFKEDIHSVTRAAFRTTGDKAIYAAGEKLFKISHNRLYELEQKLNGTVPADSNHSMKVPGSQQFKKGSKSGTKSHREYQHRPGQNRKAWHIHGVSKGTKFAAVKKGMRAGYSSGDQDSGSDSTEHEGRRDSKSTKERRWTSDGSSSEEDEEVPFAEEDEETTETEASGSDVPSESEGEDGVFDDGFNDTDDEQMEYLNWGARMTKAAMVPPVPRKYSVIEEYIIVADKERVKQKMKVQLPPDYEARNLASNDKSGDSFSNLDMPEIRDYKPRKKLGDEVQEQEVYGIDPYTHNLLWDTMPDDIAGFSDSEKQQFIEERLLLALNKEVYKFTGSDKAPTKFYLDVVVERIQMEAEADKDWALKDFCEELHKNMKNRPKDEFAAYRKGLGVVCNTSDGLDKDEFVVEFFGEVYPPWRWYEKQDGIRSLQKKEKDTTPEFYNIFYERPKGDVEGYDLLVVDAMHKANFASRLCHSCRPNCEAKITAVGNRYIIGVYTLKPVKWGEELTFDYNSVTESKEEYNNAVCLCGTQGCKGSYLNLTGSGTYEEVIHKHHGLLDRHRLLLDSCAASSLTEREEIEMKQAGLGSCLLAGLPTWVLNYAASLVNFMNLERKDLPAELRLKHEGIEGLTEVDHELTAEGVYNQRLQNLAITLDKVRHVLSEIYGDPSTAPSPLRKLGRTEMVQRIWKREDSVVHELLGCLTPHLTRETLLSLRHGIAKHTPNDLGPTLRESLLWLRDELRRLPATFKARHDAAADLIHLYAHTKCFFTSEDFRVVESSAMQILPQDLGSNRYSISGARIWKKSYSKEYIWGQLIGWYKQSVVDPGSSLLKAARGCLTLPDVSSCYAKSIQHDFRSPYGTKHREKMISHMEEKAQQKWPHSKFWSQFWCFKNDRGLFGSPMLDSVLENRPLDRQMVEWLKSRENVFSGPWDELPVEPRFVLG